MKPTTEEVQRVLTHALAELSGYTRAESLWRTIEQIAQAELQRRQQPASVPAELVADYQVAGGNPGIQWYVKPNGTIVYVKEPPTC